MLSYVLTAVVFAAAVAAAAPADDVIPAEKGGIAVHAIQHASLTLKWDDKLVLVDPAPGMSKAEGEAALAPFVGLKPDLILITHAHFDHFNVDVLLAVTGPKTTIVAPQAAFDAMPNALKARTKVLGNGDKTIAADLIVEAVAAYNTTPERTKFHPQGTGNGYVVALGGKRIYIAGDTEETPEIAHLPNIDAAFLPMNLPYTQSVDAAVKWVKDFKPKRLYPYHFYDKNGSTIDFDALKAAIGDASEVRALKWY